jgi:hypothetical protein
VQRCVPMVWERNGIHGRCDHAVQVEQGLEGCGTWAASGACELQIGMTKEPAGATMRAGVVTSKLTKKWVSTGGRKERGRRVAPMANH